MKKKIDFRKSEKQIVDLPFAGISEITYLGKCPATGVRLYECSTGNDPRGPLGIHAATEFVASEFNMKGPTINASWIACNNDRATYEKALEYAKLKWTKK